MSRKRGVQHRRKRSLNEPLIATRLTVCAGPEDLEMAKRIAHDELIEWLDDRRRGGVSWRIMPNADPATLHALSEMEGAMVHTEGVREPDTSKYEADIDVGPFEGNRSEQYGALLGFVRSNPAGYVVIAMAEASIR